MCLAIPSHAEIVGCAVDAANLAVGHFAVAVPTLSFTKVLGVESMVAVDVLDE